MNSVARTLELSIANHSSVTPEPWRQARRDDLEATANPVKRLIGVTLDNIARDQPQAASKLLDTLARTRGMRYLRHGFDSSVYRQGGEVLKVYRRTAILGDEQKADFVETASERLKVVQTFLGPICLPQQYGVETHPFRGYTVAVARQPFVAGQSLEMFDNGSPELHTTELERFFEERPEAPQELAGFLDGAISLHDNYGLVPDINGDDNFRVHGADHRLSLIDPAPIAYPEHPPIYDLILRQTEVLRAFVEKAL